MGNRLIGRTLAVLLAAVVAGIVGLGAGAAQACSCAPLKPADALAKADVVVVGKAVADYGGAESARYEFQVDRSYKRRVDSTIVITSRRQSAACGAELPLNKDVTVTLHGGDGAWTTTLCDRLTDAAALVALAGDPIEPEHVDVREAASFDDRSMGTAYDVPWTGVIVGGVVVVLVIGTAIIVVRRRSGRS